MSQINPHIKLQTILKYDRTCIYCGHKGSRSNYLTIDHVFPQSLIEDRVKNDRDNLVCSCKICNNKKKDMLLTDFIKKYKIPITKRIARFL